MGYIDMTGRVLLMSLKGQNASRDGVVVVTPSLPQDGGTIPTAIQVHAVNLIEIRLGERWQPISNQS